MPALDVKGNHVVISLEPSERRWGFLSDLRVPISSMSAVEVVPDGREAVHGVRAPGFGGPQRLIGTWRARHDRQYVCVRRGQPAVKLTLEDHKFQTVLIGLDNAHDVATTVRAAAEAR